MNGLTDKTEQLRKDKNVRRALAETTARQTAVKSQVPSGQKFIIFVYVFLSLIFGTAYYLLRTGYFESTLPFISQIQRVSLGCLMIFLLLIVKRFAKAYLIQPLDDNSARYNLNRITNLITGLVIFFIILSVLFANWYTAVVSFGLISLILGFALQTPITSFIGWIYILVKEPYRIGDRIKIGDSTGDVISVGYLETTLWEFGGQQITPDYASGRIIKFPNSMLLNSTVYNYSWSLFPYVWNEIKFQIAYQSDLKFVSRVMHETAKEEVGEEIIERIGIYRDLLSLTPVDELDIQEQPVVFFRGGENSWLDATVRYLVEPRKAGAVKTILINKILERLNSQPGMVIFPKGDSR